MEIKEENLNWRDLDRFYFYFSMEIVTSVSELIKIRKNHAPSLSIGFVPTMGALHQGHISLIERAKQETAFVICSIFVNPTQFGNAEDLEKYPRNLDQDAQLLKDNGADLLFAPDADDVYGQSSFLNFHFGHLEQVMEGKFRAGHFNGVATVVSKLFHYTSPNRAYFGQKDLQQVAVIKDLVTALSFDLEVVRCPIVRSSDGLALSSRNERLSASEKQHALTLSQSIFKVRDALLNGKTSTESLEIGNTHYESQLGNSPEYLELVYADSLLPYDDQPTASDLAVCIAGSVGPVRLIDNEVFNKT